MKTIDSRFRRLQERFSDPLLTALTIMLAILLFVVSPMQAEGIVQAHHFGIAFELLLVVAIFIVSGSVPAVVAVLTAIGLVLIATMLRLRRPSALDIYLDASA